MAPVWRSWLKKSGQHLLSVVDSLVAAHSDSNKDCGTASRGQHSRWAPVALEQGAFYSSSVIDLFQLLQGLTDQVLEQVVKPVSSVTHKAANITALAEILDAAVRRFAAHLHLAAVSLLKVGQVVMAPGSKVHSGKITRHRREESVGNSPISRCARLQENCWSVTMKHSYSQVMMRGQEPLKLLPVSPLNTLVCIVSETSKLAVW